MNTINDVVRNAKHMFIFGDKHTSGPPRRSAGTREKVQAQLTSEQDRCRLIFSRLQTARKQHGSLDRLFISKHGNCMEKTFINRLSVFISKHMLRQDTYDRTTVAANIGKSIFTNQVDISNRVDTCTRCAMLTEVKHALGGDKNKTIAKQFNQSSDLPTKFL